MPAGTISVAAGANAYEGGAPGSFVLSRTDTTAGQSVNFSFGGTASSTDYAPPMMAYFDVGQASITLTIPAADDSISEPTETIVFTLTPGADYTVGASGSATIDLIDNDPAAPPLVGIAALGVTTAGGPVGTFRITRADPTGPLTVNYVVLTTAGGVSYTVPAFVSFAAGQAWADLVVTPTEGADPTQMIAVTITLTPGTGYAVGPAGMATVNLIGNAVQPSVVWITTAAQTLSEGTTGGITLVRAGGDTTQALSVSVGIGSDGQLDTLAVWNVDYTLAATGVIGGWASLSSTGGTVTFNANVTEIVLPLAVLSSTPNATLEGFGLTILADTVHPQPIYLPGSGPVVSGPGGSATSDIWLLQGSPVSGQIGALRPDGSGTATEGWVAENNDNDNYNFNGDPDTSLDQVYDKAELGPVAGENDLVGLLIQPITNAVAGDLGSLTFTSPNIRIWANADKSGGQIISDVTTFDPTVAHTFYVEGLALSSAVNAEVITLNWQSVVLPNLKVQINRALFTVYQLTGAQNVPGYSRHTYAATVPGQVAATFGAIVNGTQHSVTPAVPAVAGAATTNALIVNWGIANEDPTKEVGGEVVGTFRVNVPGGFVSVREVNVVKVQLDKDAATNALELDGTHQVQRTDKKGVLSSNNADPAIWAMYASIEVERVAGPLVGGKRRGQRFIDIGFMQTAKFISLHGDYSANNNNFSMISSVEGNSYIDVERDETGTTAQNRPWVWKRHGNMFGQRNYIAMGDDNVLAFTMFDTRDRPSLGAVKNMVEEGVSVSFFSIVLDFVAYFAVHTKEAVNAADASYTIRASAPWRWIGSGPVDGIGTWTSILPGPAVFSSEGLTKMTESKSGDIISTALTGNEAITANDAAAVTTMTWKRNPPLAP